MTDREMTRAVVAERLIEEEIAVYMPIYKFRLNGSLE